jgi:hypothetical protein
MLQDAQGFCATISNDLKPSQHRADDERFQGLEVELAKEKKQAMAKWARPKKHITRRLEYDCAPLGGEGDWGKKVREIEGGGGGN